MLKPLPGMDKILGSIPEEEKEIRRGGQKILGKGGRKGSIWALWIILVITEIGRLKQENAPIWC